MYQFPTIAVNGYDHKSTESEYYEPGTKTQRHAPDSSEERTSTGSNPPILFHKVKNQKSILALVVSDSKIYAGTQGGEILVSYTDIMCSCAKLLRRFVPRSGRWRHMSGYPLSQHIEAAC